MALLAKDVIKAIGSNKAVGYNLVTDRNCEISNTMLYNEVTIFNYFPTQWKVGVGILIVKPGKILEYVTLYRTIYLLHVL